MKSKNCIIEPHHTFKETWFLVDENGEFVVRGVKRVYHREDGPAIVWQESMGADGDWYYYLGKRIYCSSQEEFQKLMKLKAFW